MSRLLIPDSGPLFSLAAGGLLGVLTRFNVGITDVVKWETIDKGRLPGASAEAQALSAHYDAHVKNMLILETQVGVQIAAERARNSKYQLPRNLGELSIQSLLISLQVKDPGGAAHVVLFEDAWFLRNASGFAKPCLLLSTQAFLLDLERRGLIRSAQSARAAIQARRPDLSLVVKTISNR